MLIRRLFALFALLTLTACAEPIWAPDEDIRAHNVAGTGQPSLTLITVLRSDTGEGAHTGLLINGRQRVIWDPAGTWWNPAAPERNDLHYGATQSMLTNYVDYHTRPEYDTFTHEIAVSPEVAEAAFRATSGYGAVSKAQCSISTGRILRRLPGFEGISRSFFPRRLMNSFAALPGVRENRYTDAGLRASGGQLVTAQNEIR